MPAALLDRVLTCPHLPTLPGVAVRVLELSRDPNVSIAKMAQTVQTDPALVVKVLKTVNSSYYGLSAPCPSITRAIGMLGLNTVKAIVLGFSLVESTNKSGIDEGFDLAAYWRRAVYSAAAARTIAVETKCVDPEEAFIASLVQDIGMLACYSAIKQEYSALLKGAPEDHDQVAALELKALGFDHPKIGRMLAERWRLPLQLMDCIGGHHDLSSASPENEPIVRLVILGGLAAGAMTVTDPKQKLASLMASAREWFGIEPARMKELLQQSAKGALELSRAMDVRTGKAPDITAILAQAHEQLLVAQEAVQEEAAQLRLNNQELSRKNITDGLTGAFNRAHFDHELRTAFEAVKQGSTPLAVIFIDADKFKTINDTHGHQSGDAVLMELSQRLRTAVGSRGSVFRYGGEEFAVLLPGLTLSVATPVAEELRTAVGGTPFDLTPYNVGLTLPVTISLGVSAVEPAFAAIVTQAGQVTHAADRGVYAAKAAGRNCVRTVDLSVPGPSAAAPAKAEAAAQPRTVMVVEDDPLAARLMSFLFAKCKDLKPVVVKSAEEALEWVASPSAARPRPDLVVSDLNLPGISGNDLIKALRAKAPKGARIPVLIVTASADSSNRAVSLAAGADAFIDKADFCTNTDHWLGVISGLIKQTRAAA